ncbi:MAG: HEAT repeat domain-containing protein [Planctomycetota bacterium]|jgi:HEAT repeat protein
MKTKCTIYSSLTVLLLCCCAVCFSATEEPEDAIALVIDILKGNDQEMQAVAIAMVKEIPGTEITKALAKELPNLSVMSQVRLLSALADRGDRAALPVVIIATKFRDESVRVAALKALGDLGDASSVAMLAGTAAGTRGAEQKAARESLYRLRGPEINKTILVNIPRSAGPKVKVELILSTGKRNIATGVKTLLKTTQDSDRKVRLESFKALKTVAGQKDLPALVDALIGVQSEADRREAEKTVVAVAHKISEKNRRAKVVLAALPSVKEVRSRCSLLRVLGKIGDDGAVPTLRTALKDKDDKVKDAAIRALSDWPTTEPLSDLLNVAQSSDNKIHRVLALRGFVRLIGLISERPAKETIEMYKQAMDLASSAASKRLVLSGLANVKSIGALEMAASYLEDKSLQQEAEFAVVKIAGGIGGSHPQQSKDVLKKVIQISKNDSLRRQAQEAINQIERFDDYLTAWQVSGPYTKGEADGSELFDIAFAPEESDAGDVVWRIMPVGTNKDRPWLMELDKALGGNNRAAYLRNKVWSVKSQKVRLELGSDDGIKVWLNGQLVYANNVTRAAGAGQDKVEVTLKQGWNLLLLKITQSGGEWAACARLRRLDGSKLEGLKVQTKD